MTFSARPKCRSIMDRSSCAAGEVEKYPTINCSFEHNQSFPATQKFVKRTSVGVEENVEKYMGRYPA